MKRIIIAILGATLVASAQEQVKPNDYVQASPRSIGTVGSWIDVTKDTVSGMWISNKGNHLLFAEEYEVVKTHEVCASVEGYFMESANKGKYYVRFKGMRTSATFEFTTKYDSEQWVQKFCTPDSLTSIKAGHGTFARNY